MMLTALSFSPNNSTSSIKVNLGILLLSASSWKSLGSYATLPPDDEGTLLEAAFPEDDEGFDEEGI
jgi:hypothetical protein